MTRRLTVAAFAVCLAATVPAFPQESNEPEQARSSGWRRADEPAPPERRPPSQITLPAGTWLTVRVNQELSSNHNLAGDTFTATLVQPLVAEGVVVARRGQTVGGRVTEAVKAGRVRGTARLGIELSEMTLVDGQQLPLRTQFIEYSGGTSRGSDGAAIATGTGVGAAIGAAADGGFGAGIGALAGAAASTIGVIATRGRAAEIYPEASLTFRTVEPVTISTDRSEHAFQAVRQGDYEQRQLERRPRPTLMAPYVYPYPYWGGGYYPYYYSPYFYGPGVYLRWSPRYYGGRGYGRRR